MKLFLLSLITFAIIFAIVFLIKVLIELAAAIKSLRELIKATDGSLKPALDELQLTLKSLRTLTDNINMAAEDTLVLSKSLRRIGEDIQNVSDIASETVSSVTSKVGDFLSRLKNIGELFGKFWPGKAKKKEEKDLGT